MPRTWTAFACMALAIPGLYGLSGSRALASENDFYAGPRIGMMITSPGTYADNAAAGAVIGYQFGKCCWSIEAEAVTTVTSTDWSGNSLGLFGVYRLGRVGTDTFIFFPKFKLGAIQQSYTINGKPTETTTALGGGVGLEFGDDQYVIEMEFSGAFANSLGSDETVFFSVNVIYPF